MKRRPAIAIFGLLALTLSAAPAWAQAARRQPRPEHDLRTYGVVESVPGMNDVRIERDVTFKTAGDRTLQMDVYHPPGASKAARPAVVFVNGVGDWPGNAKLRTWGQYTSWPRLVAASGLVAVTFDARNGEENLQDVRDAFAFVRDNGKRLGIDTGNVAAWACSANVRAALGLLMGPDAPAVKAAVMYYGGADDPAMRGDLPVLIVRAGKDRREQNEQIDRLATKALAANAPWTVLNVPNAHHAFDVLDDNEESRIAIRKTLAFLEERLAPKPAPAKPAPEALEPLAHFFAREWAEAETAYARYVERHPDDADALVLLGNAQVELKKPDAAAVNLKKALALDPGIGEAWSMIGRVEADKKNYPEATEALKKALALMPDDAEAQFQLGKVQLAQQEVPAAVGSLERAVELAPGNGWAWNSLGYAYLAAKQPAKAAASFERVLPYAPKNPTLLYNTACAYALAGDAGKAIELLDRAVTEGFQDKAGLMSDPDLAGVRSDPRFAGIVKKLG